MKRPKPLEKNVHRQFTEYLKYQYPKLIFRTDFAAGIKMTIGQAVQHKNLQSDPGFPDVFIAEPRPGYHGLFIELKRSHGDVYKRDGSFVANRRIQAQARMLERLNRLGYKALFACGFDQAKAEADKYLR